MKKTKPQKLPFGSSVPPSCDYCQYNDGAAGAAACILSLSMPEDGSCPRYRYDPLRREPRPAPSLRPGGYDPEDFKL